MMGQVDLHFHAALLRAAHNDAVNAFLPLIEQSMYQNVGAWLRHLGRRYHPEDHRVIAEHRQIFEAIKRGDRETARLVMLAHLAPYLAPEFRARTRGATRANLTPRPPLARSHRPEIEVKIRLYGDGEGENAGLIRS